MYENSFKRVATHYNSLNQAYYKNKLKAIEKIVESKFPNELEYIYI